MTMPERGGGDDNAPDGLPLGRSDGQRAVAILFGHGVQGIFGDADDRR